MADFIFLIFIPPVLLCMYYTGFIILAKLNINQPDQSKKVHLIRIFSGFVVFSLLALLILLIKWMLVPASSVPGR